MNNSKQRIVNPAVFRPVIPAAAVVAANRMVFGERRHLADNNRPGLPSPSLARFTLPGARATADNTARAAAVSGKPELEKPEKDQAGQGRTQDSPLLSPVLARFGLGDPSGVSPLQGIATRSMAEAGMAAVPPFPAAIPSAEGLFPAAADPQVAPELVRIGGTQADVAELQRPAENETQASTVVESSPFQADQLASRRTPLVRAVAAGLARIDRDAKKHTIVVNAETRGHQLTARLWSVRQRGVLAGLLGSQVRLLSATVQQKLTTMIVPVLGRAATVPGLALAMMARAMTIGIVAAAGLQERAAAMSGRLVAGVEGVVQRLLALARNVPIPDLPGMDRVRRGLQRVAGGVTQAVHRALTHVQSAVLGAVRSATNAMLRLVCRVFAVAVHAGMLLSAVLNRVFFTMLQTVNTLRRWLIRRVQVLGRRVDAVISGFTILVAARFALSGRLARLAIAANRRRGRAAVHRILAARSGSGERPASWLRARRLEGAALPAHAALAAIILQVRMQNRAVLHWLRRRNALLVALLSGGLQALIAEAVQRVGLVLVTIVIRLNGTISRLLQTLTTTVDRIMSGLQALIANLGRTLGSVVQIILAAVARPIDILTALTRSVLGAAASVFHRIVSILLRSLSLVGDGIEAALLRGFEAFGPASLAASIRASALPAGAALLSGLGAAVLSTTLSHSLLGMQINIVLAIAATEINTLPLVLLPLFGRPFLLSPLPPVTGGETAGTAGQGEGTR